MLFFKMIYTEIYVISIMLYSYKFIMSKQVEDQEWEDVDETEVENTICNSDVANKYKMASKWTNETLKILIEACVPGAKVGELCKLGDSTMESKCERQFKEVSRGIGFPTCISLNDCVCHNSPDINDNPEGYNVELQKGDVVRIDLGIQIDGFLAQVAHTLQILDKDEELDPSTKEANIITAAYQAMHTVIRAFRPDNALYDVTKALEHVAKLYNVQPVEGVLSHQTKQYIIDGTKCIIGKNTPQHQVYNYKFEAGTVWVLDVVFSTGDGKLKENLLLKPAIFKMELGAQQSTRTHTAAAIQKEVEVNHQNFPFSVRNLTTKGSRLGISEMLRHQILIPYPSLFEKKDSVVAHFKCTLFITDKKIERLTGIPMQSGGNKLSFDEDELLKAISKCSMSLVDKKKV